MKTPYPQGSALHAKRVPVLVAGGGTVGLSAALFLAHQGVASLVVEREAGPSRHPRATGVGPRTMELLREVGVEEAVNAAAVELPAGRLGKLSARTLASADFGRAAAAAERPRPRASSTVEVGPTASRGTIPQSRLDPVLLLAARERGATVHYSTRLASFSQEADGIVATLDGPDGQRVVQSAYLVAADGTRSDARSALGIGTSGPGSLGSPRVSILFRADLRTYTHGYSFVTCDITGTDPPGMLVTVDGAREWVLHTELDPDGDDAPVRCAELIRAAVGVLDLHVEIISVLPWRPRGLVADRFQDGRVFLVGDAARTVPPVGAFGLNAGIADAHNLAWKLTTVLSGHAGPGLLDTYEAERRPVAEITLAQALVRLGDPALHWDNGPDAPTRRAAAGAINAPIVHMGYRYDSAAIVDALGGLPSSEDVTLVLDGSPGSRLPHAWIEHDGQRLSTLDIVRSRFTVLTGAGGGPWVRAAEEIASRLGLPLAGYRIAADGDLIDPDRQWQRRVGLGDAGALLVRPDQFIAWRSATLPPDPTAELTRVLTKVLAPGAAAS